MFARIVWSGAALMLCVSITSSAQAPAAVSQATQAFRSGNIDARIKAFYSFDHPANWKLPGVASALLNLLEREDSLTVAVIRESGGRLGVGDKLGEEYGEYLGQVGDRCLRYCDREAWLTHILANISDAPELRGDEVDLLSVLYSDSLFSAAQRTRINSAFVLAARDSTSVGTRERGLAAIGVAMRSGLASAADRARFHQAVAADAADPHLDVRLAVIDRLSDLQDRADLPLLQRLAVADTATQVVGGRKIYPVRVAARAAFAAMTGRSP